MSVDFEESADADDEAEAPLLLSWLDEELLESQLLPEHELEDPESQLLPDPLPHELPECDEAVVWAAAEEVYVYDALLPGVR